ncbi:UDP-N-acetylglucosamine/UDP-N-acetylgalactosamine diphosphorylase [Pancytospora epiphaga]|nr:UDP-N-acetylglucosamine/UDP-N-acetylgalactosamine diphosphorylase [Pancytospora epiphaga]
MHPLHEEDVVTPYESDGKLNSLGVKLYKKGQEVLKSGKRLGVVVLSGGEGTRLGLTYPKGLFEIEGKPLFEWHTTRLEELHTKYGTEIYLFVMTSESTHAAVSEYFSQKAHPFLKKVEIFKQNSIEALSMTDKSPMKLGTKTIMNPMGNGDFYDAIRKAPSRSEVELFNVISVDNVLAHILDEVYIGAFYSNNLDILSKAVTAKPNENVGAFFRDGDYIKVREYSESSSDPERSPLGNICNHIFSASFVEMMGTKELPFHEAKKKIPFSDEKGKVVTPSTPNGIKRERFIFDSFAFTTKNQVISVPRNHEFSPLKNSLEAQSDNVTTCVESIKNYRLVPRILMNKDAGQGL